MRRAVMDSPIGRLLLEEDEGRLCGVRRLNGEKPMCENEGASPLLLRALAQLRAYFDGELRRFDLPLSMHGSEFDRQVWRALAAVPYGQTRSYGQIAAEIGKPNASRAVGAACGRNPLLIVVPCHRIVGASGRLTGFAAGPEAKKRLLELEGHSVSGNRLYTAPKQLDVQI